MLQCPRQSPFAVFPLDLARIVSTGLTALALIVLGVGRGVVTRRNVPVAVMETLGIAAMAAVAGFAIAPGGFILGWHASTCFSKFPHSGFLTGS